MYEIITLQLGQLANYVGTHFWNAQVSRSPNHPAPPLPPPKLKLRLKLRS